MFVKTKTIIVTILLTIFIFRAAAQEDSTQQLFISPGVSLSLITTNITSFRGANSDNLGDTINKQIAPYYYHFYYTSPEYNLSVDYVISKKTSIGMSVSYQYLKDIPISIVMIDSINYPIAQTNYNGPNEMISRLNFSWRILHLIDNTDINHFRFYWGVRFGGSIWKDKVPNNNQYNELLAQYELHSFPELTSKSSIDPSFQFLAGMRYFATSHIAFHLELGLGSPYLVEAGATFMLDMKKIKK